MQQMEAAFNVLEHGILERNWLIIPKEVNTAYSMISLVVLYMTVKRLANPVTKEKYLPILEKDAKIVILQEEK